MDRIPFAEAVARIAAAPHPAVPWRDGTQLPWDDPAFSERMLAVHLDQSTHMASRSRAVISRHVRWCWELMRAGAATSGDRPRILDLGCGPGLYCHELARLGARAVGCDFAPAPLRHAGRIADDEGLDCEFFTVDLNDPDLELAGRAGSCDAVTFWFGEFHSFPPDQAQRILAAAADCLAPDGLFVLEYQPWDLFPHEDIQEWSACERSAFSDEAHLWLQEICWNEEAEAEITVHWIIDAASGRLSRHAQCHQAYRDADLVRMCEAAGLADPVFYPPVAGIDERFEFPILAARRSVG